MRQRKSIFCHTLGSVYCICEKVHFNWNIWDSKDLEQSTYVLFYFMLASISSLTEEMENKE